MFIIHSWLLRGQYEKMDFRCFEGKIDDTSYQSSASSNFGKRCQFSCTLRFEDL